MHLGAPSSLLGLKRDVMHCAHVRTHGVFSLGHTIKTIADPIAVRFHMNTKSIAAES